MKTKFLFIALLLFPALTFAQTGGWLGFFSQGSEIWITFGVSLLTLIAAITEGTELIKAYTGANGTISKIISWGLGAVLAVAGNLMDIGIFAEATWVWTLILAAISTLVANGIFGYEFAKVILNFLTPKFHKVTQA